MTTSLSFNRTSVTNANDALKSAQESLVNITADQEQELATLRQNASCYMFDLPRLCKLATATIGSLNPQNRSYGADIESFVKETIKKIADGAADHDQVDGDRQSKMETALANSIDNVRMGEYRTVVAIKHLLSEGLYAATQGTGHTFMMGDLPVNVDKSKKADGQYETRFQLKASAIKAPDLNQQIYSEDLQGQVNEARVCLNNVSRLAMDNYADLMNDKDGRGKLGLGTVDDVVVQRFPVIS